MEQSEVKKSDNLFIANKNSPLKKIGEFLKEARQGRNISIDDLSSSLRIGKEQLIALEKGDESGLPERVFVRGMVRRISEKLNLDTSFILEELNEKSNNEPKYTPVIKNEGPKRNKNLNPLSMVILSGALGLITSIMVVKYFARTQNESINTQKGDMFLLDKNISS